MIKKQLQKGKLGHVSQGWRNCSTKAIIAQTPEQVSLLIRQID